MFMQYARLSVETPKRTLEMAKSQCLHQRTRRSPYWLVPEAQEDQQKLALWKASHHNHQIHRLSTGYPQAIRLSTGYPQAIQRLSTGYPQAIQRLSTGYPQAIHRLSTGYPQAIHRLSILNIMIYHVRMAS